MFDSKTILGTCSHCSGPVMKVNNSQIACTSCHAKPKPDGWGPVIEMAPPSDKQLLLETPSN